MIFNIISSMTSGGAVSKSVVNSSNGADISYGGNESSWFGNGCGGCGGMGGFSGFGGGFNNFGNCGCGIGGGFNMINIDIDIGLRRRCC